MRHADKTTLDLMDKYPKKRASAKNTRSKASPSKSAKKLTSKKNVPLEKKPSTLLFKLFTGLIIVLFIGVGVKFYWDESHKNPLIGKWRAQTSLGILEVQFDQNSMLFFGTKTPVSYDIGEKKVIVFDDEIKVGNTYKLIDRDTISTEAGGYKTVYKRVK
jgi:hypothetical protein